MLLDRSDATAAAVTALFSSLYRAQRETGGTVANHDHQRKVDRLLKEHGANGLAEAVKYLADRLDTLEDDQKRELDHLRSLATKRH
jgi:hypothetical protein